MVEEENATIRVLSGSYKNQIGATTGDYARVQHLDMALKPDGEWHYRGTPNDQTLFLYLIHGTLTEDDALTGFE